MASAILRKWMSSIRRLATRRPWTKKLYNPVHLEVLEDRIVLSTVRWDGGGQEPFNWSDAANWDNDRVPEPGDDVIIDGDVSQINVSGVVEVNKVTTSSPLKIQGTSFIAGTMEVHSTSLEVLGGHFASTVTMTNSALNLAIGVEGASQFTIRGESLLRGVIGVDHQVTVQGVFPTNAVVQVPEGLLNRGVLQLDSTWGGSIAELQIANNRAITNEGTIEALAGQGHACYIGGNIINSGAIVSRPSAKLFLRSGLLNQVDGEVNGEGTLSIENIVLTQTGGFINDAILINSTLKGTAVQGSLTLRGNNTLGGTIQPGSVVTVQGVFPTNAVVQVPEGLLNRGVLQLDSTWGGSIAELQIANNRAITNEGTIEALVGQGHARYIAGNIFNSGVIVSRPSAKLFLRSGLLNQVDGEVNGEGMLSLENIVLTQTGGFINDAILINSTLKGTAVQGSLTLRGNNTLGGTIQPGSVVTVQGVFPTHAEVQVPEGLLNRGAIQLDSTWGGSHSRITVTNNNAITNEGGIVALRGAGNHRYIEGNINNSGHVIINAPTTLVSGTFNNQGFINVFDSSFTIQSSALLTNAVTGFISGGGVLHASSTGLVNHGYIDLTEPSILEALAYTDAIIVKYYSNVGMNVESVTNLQHYQIISAGINNQFGDDDDIDLTSHLSAIDHADWIGENAYQLSFDTPLPFQSLRLIAAGHQIFDVQGIALFNGPATMTLLPDQTPAQIDLRLSEASDTGVFVGDGLTNINTPVFDIWVSKAGRIELDINRDGQPDVQQDVDFAGTYHLTSPVLAEGQHEIRARFIPKWGETVSDVLHIRIDQTPPNDSGGLFTGTAPYYETDRFLLSEIVYNESNFTVVDSAGTHYAVELWEMPDPLGGEISTFMFVFETPLTEPDDYVLTIPVGLVTDYAGNSNTASITITFRVAADDEVNLHPEQLTVNSSAVFGQSINVTWMARNLGSVGASGSWVDRIYLSRDQVLDINDVVLGSQFGPNSLAAGSQYSRSPSVQLPSHQSYLSGQYFLIVVVDQNNAIQESNENDNTLSLELHINAAPTPNLQVTQFAAPASIRPGERVELQWFVSNVADVAAAGSWVDRLYLTKDGNIQGLAPVAEVIHQGGLAGQTTIDSGLIRIMVPSFTEGSYQWVVVTDANHSIYESGQGEDDNHAILNTSLIAPDLISEIIEAPVNVQSGDTITVSWIDKNQGTADILGSWTDRVYLSTSQNPGGRLLGSVVNTQTLQVGQSTSLRTAEFTIPPELSGSFFLVVVTDADGEVIEPGEENNNIAFSPLNIELSPFADLAVTNIQGPNLVIGDPGRVTVSWTVTNIGIAPGRTGTWTDRVVAISGTGAEIVLSKLLESGLRQSDFVHNGLLNPGESYTENHEFTLPAGLTGRFKLEVRTDAKTEVFEYGLEENNKLKLAGHFDIMPIPYADLVVQSVSVDMPVSSGQPATIRWTVANQGIGLTSSGSWADTIYLSRDAEGTQRIVGTDTIFEHFGFLSAGGTYERVGTVKVPDGLTGDIYVVVRVADPEATRKVQSILPFEHVYAGNNITVAGPIAVTLSNSPDLSVVPNSILAPDHASEGESIDIFWTVINNGQVPATGSWTDKVFLERTIASPDGSFERLLIGSFVNNGPLGAGHSYTRHEQIILPSHIQHAYKVVVLTNSDATLYESNRGNNTGIRTKLLPVSALDRPDLLVAYHLETGPNGQEIKVYDVSVPAAFTPGGPVDVQFTIANRGKAEANGKWIDQVYLSVDNKLGLDDLLLGTLESSHSLIPESADTSPNRSLSSYRSASLHYDKVPERYRGTVFFIIKTDSKEVVDEWPNESNNVVAIASYATPLPLPDLVVSGVRIDQGSAATQIIAGSTVTVGYTVTNKGSGPTLVKEWTETIWLTKDKNRPHPKHGDILLTTLRRQRNDVLSRFQSYDASIEVTIPDGITGGVQLDNGTEQGEWFITPWVDPYDAVLEDTLDDNINHDDPNQIDNNNYKAFPVSILVRQADLEVTSLTADPLGTGGTTFNVSYYVKNNGNGGAAGGYVDRVYLSDTMDPFAENSHALLLKEVVRSESVARLTGYTRNLSIDLSPSAAGRYIIVVTDASNKVREVSEANNRNIVATLVKPVPGNLKVSNVIFEQDNLSGEDTIIRYTVTNDSDSPIWPGSTQWKDFIWVSPDQTFDRMRATYLGEMVRNQNHVLAPHASYEVVFRTKWPKGAGGQYYLHIHLDAHNDLNPTFYPIDSRQLKKDWWPADGGQNGWPKDNQGWLDHFSRWANEDPRDNLSTTPINITYREPDLQVGSVTAGTGATSGKSLTVNYTITNRGTRDTREDSWTDRIFLSRDAALDDKDLFIGELTHTGILRTSESYTRTINVTLPDGIGGNYYLLVYADSPASMDFNGVVFSDIGYGLPGVVFEKPTPLTIWDLASAAARSLGRGRVLEYQFEGNNLAHIALPVTLAPAPDLRVTSVRTTENASRGQTLDLVYTVSNLGQAGTPVTQSSWTDLIYLSRDPKLDLLTDRYLTAVPHGGGLAKGGSYSNSVTLQLPTDLLGSWYVIVVTDPVRSGVVGSVFENGLEQNNDRASQAVIISLPPPVDLVIADISSSKIAAHPGDAVDVTWTIRNDSHETVTGRWTDSVYLSTDGAWGLDDKLLGRVLFKGTLLPGQTYSSTLKTILPGVTPGAYRFIVRADIYNQVYEDRGDANNDQASADVLNVLAEHLELGNPKTTKLATGQERLYVITVPEGETLRVALSGGGTQALHELYLRNEQAPSSANYDAAPESQISSDVAAVIPGTKAGVYYVLIRGQYEPDANAELTLRAGLVPLAVTSVKTDVGGDSKYVTTTIRGAKFKKPIPAVPESPGVAAQPGVPGVTVMLSRPGFSTIIPETTLWIDETTIKATFDFTGVPHGLYDLTVTNPDGAKVVIPYRFLVEKAIEPDITVGLGGPRIIMAGDTGLYSVALQSLSNLDTPYTYLQFGIPEMGINHEVYNLPYLQFASNFLGGPLQGPLMGLPWNNVNSAVNTTGQLLAGGYALNLPADGFTGLTFTTTTYPGLKEMNDRAFEQMKEKLYALLPDLAAQDFLANGPKGLDLIFEGLSLLYDAWGQLPGLLEKPYVPFQFNVTAAATALTRDEFEAQIKAESEKVRLGILQDPEAPAALTALASNPEDWQSAYLLSLQQAGLLTAENVAPLIQKHTPLVSLMATLGAGLLGSSAGQAGLIELYLREHPDRLHETRPEAGDFDSFFEYVRRWYGHDPNLKAIEDQYAPGFVAPTFEWFPPELGNANWTAAFPTAEQFRIAAAAASTHFESFRVYVPWVAWGARNSLPSDYLISGVTPDGSPQVSPLDLSRFLTTPAASSGAASITGPFTAQTRGFVPVGQDLPFTVQFQNDAMAPTRTGEVRVVINLDDQFDARSFRL